MCSSDLKVLVQGNHRMDRTGVGTTALFCETMQFNMDDGFPAVTTKKLAFKQVVGELLGFIKGCDNAAQFRDLGCRIWDANARAPYWLSSPHHSGKHDDLGRIYGVQWRRWKNLGCMKIDQLAGVIEGIKHDPSNRRLIVSAWNVGELEEMALPPCHMMFQFFVRQDTYGSYLDLMMLQRSCAMFLGVPFNISSYALLLHMVSKVTGLTPGVFTHVPNDVHVYDNHVDQAHEQKAREPYPLPKLAMNRDIRNIDDFKPEDFELEGYQHHAPIKAEMAV